MLPIPFPPGPGQESVWEYPRPPRLEATPRRLEVVFNGVKIADTQRGLRVLETSHPPVYYFPPEDITHGVLIPFNRRTFCEWKGAALYYTVRVGEREAVAAAWYYPQPTLPFAALREYVAFYPQPMDECRVDGERVVPQPGHFYGGWITADVVGPFKGEPGSAGW